MPSTPACVRPTHAASDGEDLRKLDPALAPNHYGPWRLGDARVHSLRWTPLIGKLKPGETVVVAAASGPVGSLLGELARMAGARAVGIAGEIEKCRHVKDELGFDTAINHKASDFGERLAEACPHAIDIYFENVGGAIWPAVLPLLSRFARVPLGGLIAQYNGIEKAQGRDQLDATMREVLTKSLTVRGFISADFFSEHYAQFVQIVSGAVADGRVRYKRRHHRWAGERARSLHVDVGGAQLR